MQHKRPLDYLMPHVRQQVLSALLISRAGPWYIADLGQRLGLHHASLQRELSALLHAGVLRTWREGNRTYFERDSNCPFLPELRMILLKTVGLVDRVNAALEGVEGKVTVAFVYGSIARGEETSASDVDLMVVGEVTLAELAARLKPLESELGRDVNPSVYTPQDFRSKVAGGAHFLSKVMGAEKVFIIGTSNDLARLTERGLGKTT